MYIEQIDVPLTIPMNSLYTISWSTYNGFNVRDLTGAPNYDPTVTITTFADSNRSTFGPFPLNSSTTLLSPYYVPISYKVLVSITGQQDLKYNKLQDVTVTAYDQGS
jgi:hypothetical protein